MNPSISLNQALSWLASQNYDSFEDADVICDILRAYGEPGWRFEPVMLFRDDTTYRIGVSSL